MAELKEKIKAIESVFTLVVPEGIADDRLREMQPKLESEIKDLQEAETKHEHDDEELCQALDLLTWVEFKIGSLNEAFERNKEAMTVAQSSWGSLFSRGNRIHLLWRKGDLTQVKIELNELDRIKNGIDSRDMITAVKARQAYCYFRFGDSKSLKKAIALYEEVLDTTPEMHLWRLQAGQVCRRLGNPDMQGENNIDLKSKGERHEKADEFLHHVTKHSKNPRLQAFAFSDLATAAYIHKDAEGNLEYFCSEALRLCGNHPYVLLYCGKSLKFIDTERAVELVTKATTILPTTHTFSILGNCLNYFAHKQQKNRPIAKRLAEKAEENYRKAISLSSQNIPARFSLGLLLCKWGKVEKALKEYLHIIKSFRSDDFAHTLMKTYIQASICLLKLQMKEDAEEMLIKAVSIAFKFLSRGKKEFYLTLKESFSLNYDMRETYDSPEALLFGRVYRLTNDPEISEIDMSEDAAVTISTIEKYLDLGCFEEALALMNWSIAVRSHRVDDRLSNKVALSAARNRLMHYGGDATFVFKSMFDSYILECHGLGTSDEERVPSLETSPETDITGSCDKLDVLIVYDEPRGGVEDWSYLGAICNKLQRLMKKVFGLKVSSNLHRYCADEPEVSSQVDEMSKAELIIVVFGLEKLSGYFESLLEFLPKVLEKSEENLYPPRVLLAVTEDGVTLPPSFRQFQKTQIADVLGSLDEFEEWHQEQQADAPHGASNNERINACVENMMSFFCSLLSITWPLATEETPEEK
ncbi:type iv pilus biogenesis/stability protein pilw [Plakobranchus ocellatus]|uniref:Type iv pilus biogenesis/stability protein pilw n=1 Tax=Plakobranchus ocellatus TaxID=259542 RepID=A0AAV3XZG9_9GAST|nr:type iv pilus biogenesis/stability protein pilw [Plakobranchus ocellatus]